ncbi:MAG: PAS domain S-box protein [Acidobacteria bacterium]|nr:PAS domain S-box protein [Acidobacteriota bacterium]
MLISFIQNIALVLGLSMLYGMLTRVSMNETPRGKILSGFLFGGIAIAAMMIPIHYTPGIIYDGRSIILALAGLFGGGTATVISVAMAGLYRAHLGGVGMWAGIATITASALTGLAFRRAYGNHPEKLTILPLFVLGFTVHFIMLACQLLIQPWPAGLIVLRQIWLPVMLIFPAATVLIGYLLGMEKRHIITEHKLASSEARYRNILENMQEGYYETDLAGNLVFFNRSLCRLLGYSEDELMKMNYRNYTDKENAEKLYRAFNKVYQTGIPVLGVDWEITGKDGIKHTIKASVSLIKDPSGIPAGFQGLVRDITEEKLAESMLRESINSFRSIYNNISIGLYRTTPDGRILMANPALIQMLGFSSFDELEKRNLETDPVYEPGTPRKEFRELLEQYGKVKGCISAWKRKDGTSLWVCENSRVVRDDAGEIIYYEGTVEDITERKLAEERLRESEKKYRLIFNNAPLGIFHYDADGIISSCNDKFVEIIGSSRKQLIGLHMMNLPDKRVAQAVRKSLNKEAGFYEGDYHSVTADKITPIRVFFEPVISENGEVKGGVGICEDITERKQAEAEREKLREQLFQAQKIESVGRLAGGVAHDFNNMLGVILGRAEMLLTKMSPDDPNRSNVEAIMRAGDRSADLTRQLLTFARKQTIQPKIMNLNDAIEGMLKMLRRLIGENIDLIWQPAAILWTVRMDPVQVDQILANLCINARDAIPKTGTITIETENREIDHIYCETHTEAIPGSYVMLAVSDDGCGMNEKTRRQIFEPFFTTKAVGKGTGLGLSTVHGIVKQNKGFINVYSEPDEGSTFRIYIPKHGEKLTEKAEDVNIPIPRGKGRQILLVEDEAGLLEMTKTMLEELEYSVYAAARPMEALSFLRGKGCVPDLLLTDVVMPEMNGKELAEKITKMCEQVKVLFMSGYTANAIAHHGVLDKEVAFIQKPFSLNELAQAIAKILG